MTKIIREDVPVSTGNFAKFTTCDNIFIKYDTKNMPQLKHITSSLDLTKKIYDELFRHAEKFAQEGIPTDLCKGKVAATLFFQPSTRTMMSFQSAMIRAGGGWIGISGGKGLSTEKDESFEDTIRTFGSFADVIVLRHPDDDSATRAAECSLVPVISGGSGSREHPLAGVMLLFDLLHNLKHPLEGLTVGLYGTPEINRVSKSLVPILGMYNMRLFIDDLGHFPLPKEIEELAKKNGLRELAYDKLDNFIGEIDALFVTRGLQKGIIPEDKFPKKKAELILKSYKPITTEHMKKMRQDAVLCMILPRIFEIDTAVDKDPRALYAKRGIYTEIALAVIAYVLDIKV